MPIPTNVAISGDGEVIVVARRVGKMRPEFLCIFDLLPDLLHELIEIRLAIVFILVSIGVSLTAPVVAAATIVIAATGREVFVSWKFERLHLDFLIVPAILLIHGIGSSFRSFVGVGVRLVVDEEIGIGIEEWKRCASLST